MVIGHIVGVMSSKQKEKIMKHLKATSKLMPVKAFTEEDIKAWIEEIKALIFGS